MIRTIVASSAVALLAVSAHAAPVQFKPGKWSADITMTAFGETFSESMTECMLPEESNLEPTELAQEFAGGTDGCVASNVRQNANSVSFTMRCPGEGLSEVDFNLTHQPTSFVMTGDGQLNIGDGQLIPAQMNVSARYIGVCDQ